MPSSGPAARSKVMGDTTRRDQRRADRRFIAYTLTAGRKLREDTDTATAVASDTELLAVWTRHHIRTDPNSSPSIPTELARRRLMRLIEKSARQLERRGQEPRLVERAEEELRRQWLLENPDQTVPEDHVIIAVADYEPDWVHPAAWVLRDRYYLCGERFGPGAAVLTGLLRVPRYVRDLIQTRETRWRQERQSGLADPNPMLRATADDLAEPELEALRGLWSSDPESELNDLHEAIAAVRLLL